MSLFLFSAVLFFKMLIQYGVPNKPLKNLSYFTAFGMVLFFGLSAFPLPASEKWKSAALATTLLGLILEIFTFDGLFPSHQLKVISKLPLLVGLLVAYSFPNSDTMSLVFLAGTISCLGFLTNSVGKARYQKRLYVKMSLFLVLGAILTPFFYFIYLFYFFLLQQSFGVMSLIQETKAAAP